MKNIIQGLYYDRASKVPLSLLLAGSAVLFIMGWYFTKDLVHSLDVLFWDEANYMQAGKMITEKLNRSWGPSYAIWYKILSFFESDSVRLYYLNYRWMTILTAISLYLLLAVSNIRLWVSFSIGLFFLFAELNLPVWPKVTHYCVFVFLIGIVIMKQLPSTLIKIAFMSVVALEISYARPEFYLTYLTIFFLWIIALFFKSFRTKNALIISIALIAFGFFIQYFMGNPLFNFKGDRSGLAFAQHFMLNYFQWKHIDQDFWITWMTYYQDLFHNAPSIKEAYRANPKLLHLHFLMNFQNFIALCFHYFSDAMLPEKLIRIPQAIRILILGLGGAIMLAFSFQNKVLQTISQGIKHNIFTILLLFLIAAPATISCLVIYPRAHYMLFLYVFVIYCISILFFSKTAQSSVYDKNTFILSAIVLGFVCIQLPTTKDYHFFDLWRKETSQANLKTIEKLRSYNFQEPIRLLENEGGMNLFLGKNYTWVRGFAKDTTWTAYIDKEKVDIIYVTPSLVRYPTLQSDSTWKEFITQPTNYGFVKVQTGNFTPYLLIQQHLLKDNTK